ncbi:MAG: class I tRNA ligase family protein [bacterium]|nr:class I tRNA ligase family protein [bacterium]
MDRYDHKKIEKKWQKRWEESQAFRADDDSKKQKDYILIEFPYPSGDGLHVGHVRSWTAMDVVARKRRAQGRNVLYPIGWDAFGLPTENYALKTGKDPRVVTRENTDNFRRQIKSLGISFDWSREVNTTDPNYYKWTQWIFLQLFKKGLAYKAQTQINWCPKDKIGLANEEVLTHSTSSGQVAVCERCGTPVEKRLKEQWMLAITKYAQRLYDDLDTVDYIPAAKIGQRNWIGPSEGAAIEFSISSAGETCGSAKVFTTRPDTLFGATYLVLAPEHALVHELAEKVENKDEVVRYITAAKNKNEIDRTTEGKEKTGVELKGVKAINPANKEEIPIFVADYVLGGYGTGAIMAVPAHDERDFAFAKKFDLPIKIVIEPHIIQTTGSSPYREGEPIVSRDGIIAIVKHWSEEKYIGLQWKKVDWHTFITGGIEKDQTPEEAGITEIREETGFLTPKLVKEFGVVHGQFYHVPKKENRLVHGHILYFELQDDTHEKISEKESAIHDIHWLSAEELVSWLTPKTHTYALELQQKGVALYTGEGILTNSGKFNDLSSEDAKKKITEFVGGRWVTTFKLRDWVFSRQRYWGEPIPLIHCQKDGWVAVPEADLPVELPVVEKYQPTDTGESPLANIKEFVDTACPKCGGLAKRETDVMPNWAGSSWYWLRYCDPHNDKEFASQEKLDYWVGSVARQGLTLPQSGGVDWYNGGMEHTTLHLLYSRFWHKFLFDIGVVPTSEPYIKRTSHGLILAADGSKMSKSKGNTVSPDELVERFGADSLRLYEMFIGPFDQPVAWSTNSILGVRRFLERVWALGARTSDVPGTSDVQTEVLLNQTIKKVSDDIEHLKMNTAVSALMILANQLAELEKVPHVAYKTLLQLLAPFAPHITHELAETLGLERAQWEVWPAFDESKIAATTAVVAVQVNGRLRASIELATGTTKEEVIARARAEPAVVRYLAGGKEQKVVYVPGKVVNFVLEDPEELKS